MTQDVVIVGGGVAGCAAAVALARKGAVVTLVEKEVTPKNKVCGEFLSGEALEDLRLLGIDVAALGAVPLNRVRLAAARRASEAPLPFPAASLTRKTLDTALYEAAVAAGAKVVRGVSVLGLERVSTLASQQVSESASQRADGWRAVLSDGGVVEAPVAFLASGKHDLRGHGRASDPHKWVAFKMYYRLAPKQAEELKDASELMLYPGGYGGIQPVEHGVANLCCLIQHKYLPKGGNRWEQFLALMKRACPHLVMRLEGAVPLLEKPIAISGIPYGFVRRTTEDGLYCIGDQAAVIPSFTGDGISIAMHTARNAAQALFAGESAMVFQAQQAKQLMPQMRLAEAAHHGLNNAPARALLPFGLKLFPGVMSWTAKLTRIAHGAEHTPEVGPTALAS